MCLLFLMKAVCEVLGSAFQKVYAEGHPEGKTRWLARAG
jgi:hypothetical protein